MFDQEDIYAYMSTKAPSDLKARILQSAEAMEPKRAKILPSGRLVKQLSGVAACFLLVVTVFSVMLLGEPNVSLQYGGEGVTEAGVALSEVQPVALYEGAGRSLPGIHIPLTLEAEEPTVITVRDGLLYEAGGEEELLGEQTEICGVTHLLWVLDAETDMSELVVKCGLHKAVYGWKTTDDAPMGILYKK